MRLINADDLVERLDALCDLNCPYTKKQRSVMCGSCALGSAFDAVEDMPTIEQPEPCEDAVSRAEAIRVASGYCHPANIAKELERLPSVQPNVHDLPKDADCISRQAAIDAVSEYATIWMDYTEAMTKEEIAQEALNSAKDTMIRIIQGLPSAQPEIIRCRDCRHGYVFEPWDGEDACRYCRRMRLGINRDSDMCVNDDDFCSQAERRTDEADKC